MLMIHPPLSSSSSRPSLLVSHRLLAETRRGTRVLTGDRGGKARTTTQARDLMADEFCLRSVRLRSGVVSSNYLSDTVVQCWFSTDSPKGKMPKGGPLDEVEFRAPALPDSGCRGGRD